jgi:hypothetical protein
MWTPLKASIRLWRTEPFSLFSFLLFAVRRELCCDGCLPTTTDFRGKHRVLFCCKLSTYFPYFIDRYNLLLPLFIINCKDWPPLWSSGQSSWLHNGDVLCFLWGTNWIYICYVEERRPPLWSSGESSWLHNGDVLCFLWGTNWIYICYVEESRPLLWSSGQSSWLHNGDVLCFLWGKNWIYVYYVEESRPPLWSSGQSSWLQNWDVLCFLWSTSWIYICYVEEGRTTLWSCGRSCWLQIQRSGFDLRRYQIFWEAVGLERGPLIQLYICIQL